ncbi:DsbA family protein [Edaphobacter bradus]|uniref:DsbA family protein n=1 Tax=Edaphobacter bradus TaxID=2259016 RepID=UPI0021E022AE|nr:thioredoxin domain-containing protein [Edaphobacter bradus]
MKIGNVVLAAWTALSVTTMAGAQTGAANGAAAAPKAQQPAPLQLQSLDQTSRPDPFPPVNQKYFTASSPTVDTVNAFLKALWGYDPNRIWRVEAIQATQAPSISKVVVFVTERTPNAKVQSTAFFVTPDGKHAIEPLSASVIPFGEKPFVDARKTLEERADGAYRGAAGKDLLLVEFADLQCPHCKEAQSTMDQLAKDFPNAHIIFQSFPLVEVHPFAFKAAAYGYCISKQKNDAFFSFSSAVFDNQAGLTPDTGDQTLKDAVTKAGLDPAAIDSCAATQETKDKVNASIKLAEAVGVDQTPMLAVNGRLLPLSQVAYETLKNIISYQAVQDGVTGAAPAAARIAPTLGK